MEIRMARSQALGEGEGVSGFHQDVEAPALHLAALVLVSFVEKRQLIHRRIGSLSWRRFLREGVCFDRRYSGCSAGALAFR